MHISDYQWPNGSSGHNLGQIGPKEPNWIGEPIFIVETCLFGSSHRFDCYDHPQGMSEVTLIPYQPPDGQFGAVPEILVLSESFRKFPPVRLIIKCSLMVSISHFKMLWTVSRTYYGEVALSSPIFFVFFFILIYTVDSLFGWFYKHILFWSQCFWFSNLCHHKDPILAIGILQPMMLLLWTVHHLKDPHYSNVECISRGILKCIMHNFTSLFGNPT